MGIVEVVVVVVVVVVVGVGVGVEVEVVVEVEVGVEVEVVVGVEVGVGVVVEVGVGVVVELNIMSNQSNPPPLTPFSSTGSAGGGVEGDREFHYWALLNSPEYRHTEQLSKEHFLWNSPGRHMLTIRALIVANQKLTEQLKGECR